MGAGTGKVGLLVIREARPSVLPRPFCCGLCKLRPGFSEQDFGCWLVAAHWLLLASLRVWCLAG